MAVSVDGHAADATDATGEMGAQLSGGQRQRLALARALGADAPVLVLHDSSTAVDSVTEQAIASRIAGVRTGCTTVLVASSPALLGACDRVVDVRDGHEAPACRSRPAGTPGGCSRNWDVATSRC